VPAVCPVVRTQRPPAPGGPAVAPCYRLHVSRPLAVMGVGAVLIVVTFLLAFTIFGEISAVAGIACVGGGAMMLRRRSSR
jgi:hypothetical protein